MMPAEWEDHAECYVSWPCREETWRGHAREAKRAYAEVIMCLRRFERVTALSDPSTLGEARSTLDPGVDVLEVELDDAWIRDNGPFFVRRPDGRVAAVRFRFNGWGGKSPHLRDERVPVHLAEHLGMRHYDAPLVLEGGSVCVDGRGTLLTTEQCLLNPNRNPGMSRERIEASLAEYLGIRKVIWLGRGQAGDLTDGHVDGVAAFAGPGLVVAAYTPDASDPNYTALTENLGRLETATDSRGRSLEVVKLPQPRDRLLHGVPITPSYANHYLANGGLVAPTYGIREDRVALGILGIVHPDREIVGVDARYLEVGGGAVHCITQQRPTGRPLPP
jgi:agmatine deiminase